MAARHPSERGAALLAVLVSVAVLTAVATDLAYESRVALRIAANARDELRAGYQARSGVALSRMVVEFQRQLDEASPKVATGGTAMPRILLWRALPVSSDLVGGLFAGGKGLFATPDAAAGGGGGLFAGSLFGPEPATTAKGERRARAGAASFDAVLEDEATKVNAQLEALAGSTNTTLDGQLLSLYQLTCDPRWDPLFDREDASGYRGNRADLLVRLREWVDNVPGTEALNASFATANCSMTLRLPYFQEGFGDKNAPYDRGDDRYKTKNARMDSLDELFQVAGVSDAFMAAFRDQLTVYLPTDAKPSLDDRSRTGLLLNARRFAEPTPQNWAVLQDPAFLDRFQKLIVQTTLGGNLGISSAQQYALLVAAAGVTVNQKAVEAAKPADTATTYRIRSTGTAGDVKTTVDAIVRVEKPTAGDPVGAPGRVIHWREE